tara:strand:- start:236 stop:568 length:333 start_codon:yes stop_codon:yes gene_type:complete
MSDNFYIKQNDTAPSLEVVLTSSSGRAKPMTEASSIAFNMSTEAGVNIVSLGTGTIVNSVKGIVAYTWQTGDTSNTGIHNAEFQVTYNNGQIETFPNSGYIKVIIKGELA